MEKQSLNARLSQISTAWSVLRQAHDGPADAVAAAQQFLLQRYGGAVHRYLLATLRDSHAADDLTQEFGLRLVRGDFHHADPRRGHFRHYVKTVLFHLVSRYRKQQQTQPLASDSPELADLSVRDEDAEHCFQDSWREQLLSRAWEALAEAQPLFYAVLHFRAANPGLTSAEMAEQLSRQLDRPLTPAAARQALHRAREKFAELLIDEVAQSFERPTAEHVEQELLDLGLLTYCQAALARYVRGS